MDFGAPRPLDKPIDDDKMNFAPRAGFAWTVDGAGATVVRGGVGVFTTGHIMALFQNAVARPFTPIRQGWNRTEQEARGIVWPNTYAEDAEKIAIADSGGKKNLYYMFQTDMKSPETVQATFDVQRQIGRRASVSAGYVHTSGKNMPILLNFANAYDRVTGARPNPGFNPGGWYVTSGQTMVYNAFEGNANLRRAHGLDLAVHYTLSKGWSEQGANLIGNFNSSIGDGGSSSGYNNTQDFFDPLLDVDYSPLVGEVRHRVTSTVVYDLPWLADRKDVVGSVFGGWQISSVLNFRSRRTAADYPGVGHCEQPARLQRRQPDIRRLARYAAVPRSQRVHAGADLPDDGGDDSAGQPELLGGARARPPARGPDACEDVHLARHLADPVSL